MNQRSNPAPPGVPTASAPATTGAVEGVAGQRLVVLDVLRGAAQRARRPRVVLLRRLVVLLVLGLGHHVLQPGEVLASYALYGVVLLLPLSYLPRRWRWVPLALGAAALVVAAATHREPQSNDAGMMLLGFGAARSGLLERLERPGRGVVLAAGVLVPLYAVTLVAQRTVSNPIVDGVAEAWTWADFAAGVVGAALYAVLVVLALRTGLRRALRAVFEPLGRTALSNYVGATLLAVLARLVWSDPEVTSTLPDLVLAAAILPVQVPASRWWLARHRYGPLEWTWRCATWWSAVPSRRPPTAPA